MDTGAWTGKMLGKYEIGTLVGQGGMAEVYKGRHSALNRNVAVKLIHPHLASREGFVERFQREAQVVAALRHSNIVQVFDLDSYAGVYYMVMEFIDGPTLAGQLEELRAKGRQFPLRQTLNLIITLCDALDYAHARGMIHRDLKPSNVMFTAQGQPVLTDFGLAKIVGGATSGTMSGLVVGTPMYMSPEQGYGKPVDARSDIYSLGVILYELATGHPPFEGDTPLSIMMKHVNEPLPSASDVNSRVSEAIEMVIAKATAKLPSGRYQTCAEFSAALQVTQTSLGYLDDEELPASRKQTGPLTPPAPKTPTPLPISPTAPTVLDRKTAPLNELSSIFVQVLGPIGRIMDVNRMAIALGEKPESFPVNRLDELLDRIAAHYRIVDNQKRAQIRQMVQDQFKP